MTKRNLVGEPMTPEVLKAWRKKERARKAAIMQKFLGEHPGFAEIRTLKDGRQTIKPKKTVK